jgi:hypothetical protein
MPRSSSAYVSSVNGIFSRGPVLCRTQSKQTPDAIVLSAGLWHMLHVDDPVDYSGQLQNLKQAINAFFANRPMVSYSCPCFMLWPKQCRPFVHSCCLCHNTRICLICTVWWQVAPGPPISFFSISEVYPPKLKTDEKRLHLTYDNVDWYNEAIQQSGLLVPQGPLYLVDLHHLTQGAPALVTK